MTSAGEPVAENGMASRHRGTIPVGVSDGAGRAVGRRNVEVHDVLPRPEFRVERDDRIVTVVCLDEHDADAALRRLCDLQPANETQ